MELNEVKLNGGAYRYRDVTREDGVVRLEYFHDLDPDRPTAYATFLARMARFHQEMEHWRTVVLDSVTLMEVCARKWEEKVINPMTKYAKGTDTRQWFAGSTDHLEEMLIIRFAGLPINVLILCHIDERRNEVSGEILRGAFAPGRLSKRGQINAAYQEQYHAYRALGDQGYFYALQTAPHDGWVACSQLGAPDPCFPHYESVWVAWGRDRMPVHCMTYGDSGTGKSTFAATWPKPMLVWCFDPFGKDIPYLI